MAAGLAGGSSNGAAVLHGLNKLWNLKMSLKELCEIGAELGSDVPFCGITLVQILQDIQRGILGSIIDKNKFDLCVELMFYF